MEFSFEELVSALEGEVVINNDYKKFKCTCIDNSICKDKNSN